MAAGSVKRKPRRRRKLVLKAFLMDSIRCYLFYIFKIRLEKFYGTAVSLHQSFYARLSCFSQFDKQLMRISAKGDSSVE